jgi:transposase
MPRTHGYAPRGRRCFGIHDWHARGRTNVIGALLGGSLLTACLFSCNIDSDVFQGWLTGDLIPKLPPGCVLVMDNATFHKRQDMKEAIKNAGHTLQYLPPYSPDLNPIENKWAQAKAIRKKNKCKIDELFKDYDF